MSTDFLSNNEIKVDSSENPDNKTEVSNEIWNSNEKPLSFSEAEKAIKGVMDRIKQSLTWTISIAIDILRDSPDEGWEKVQALKEKLNKKELTWEEISDAFRAIIDLFDKHWWSDREKEAVQEFKQTMNELLNVHSELSNSKCLTYVIKTLEGNLGDSLKNIVETYDRIIVPPQNKPKQNSWWGSPFMPIT